jgi:hypothetical protein
MKPQDDLLKRMLRAAREPRVETPEPAPPGFAARVVAHWTRSARETTLLPILERLSGRAAVGLACTAFVTGFAVWQTWRPVQPDAETALVAQLSQLVFAQ